MSKGRYYFLQSALNDFVLEISSDPSPGQTVVMQPYEENKNTQLWYTDPILDVIRSKADDRYVLDMRGDGSSLIVSECNENDASQKWHFYKDRVVNLETYKSLDIAGGCRDAGAKVLCWDYGRHQHQTFSRVYVEPKSFLLRSRLNGFCLDVSGGDDSAGANVITWPEHGGTNQQWYEGLHGMIHSRINGYVLDSSDDHFELQPYDGTLKNRQWIRSGRRIINFFEPTRCVEIKDGNDAEGSEIIDGEFANHPHQEWEAVFV
jgi:hypothetical protein